MDLVVNHSSDEHEWFHQSRQSRTSPYRDYLPLSGMPNAANPTSGIACLTSTTMPGNIGFRNQRLLPTYFSRKQPDLELGESQTPPWKCMIS